MRITVDTDKDSADDIRKVIRFLRLLIHDSKKDEDYQVAEESTQGFFEMMDREEQEMTETEQQKSDDVGVELY